MLITVEDVQARTGITYVDTELTKVQAFIDDVSALITDYVAPITIPNPTPASIKATAVMEVRRYLNTEPGVSQERIDNLSEGFAWGGASYALSPQAEHALRRWVRTITGGVSTFQLVRPDKPDVIPPSVPMGLAVSAVTSTSITLTWTASVDDRCVEGYRVFEGSALVADVCGPTATVQGLAPSSTHTYAVAAYDELNNLSGLSTPVTGVTSA